MSTLNTAAQVIYYLWQQSAFDMGPGGHIPTELRLIHNAVKEGTVAPRVGLDLARTIATYGENEVFLREENVLACMPVH